VNDAVFVFESTEFTGACNEFPYDLLSLIANNRGDLIDQDSLFISYERNPTKSSDQRFLSVTSWQCCLEAFPLPMRGVNGALKTFCYSSGGAAIFGCHRVGQGLLNNPFIVAQPGDVDGKLIVLDKTPIFVLVCFQDGIIGAGGQMESSQRFSSLSIRRELLFDVSSQFGGVWQ